MTVIAGLAKKYDAYVVTDEVYEHIIYAPNKMVYMAALPGMKERTIVCGSLSKTYSLTGWRLGYTIAPPEITDRIKKVHDFLTVGAAAPLQEAIVTGLKFGQEYYDELTAKYTHKRDIMCKGLDSIGLRHNVPEGAYYIMIDFKDYMKKLNVTSDLEFAEILCRDVGVGMVPGSSFFKENVNDYLRIHFAKKDETLNSALERLSEINRKLK